MRARAGALLSLLFVCTVTAVPVLQKRGGKGVSVLKTQQSHFVNVNGRMEGQRTKQETVKDASSDATLASMKEATEVHQEGPGEKPHGITRTQMDIPSLGIHDTRVEDSSVPYRQMMVEKKNPNPGYPWIGEETERPEYTPADLAEYIIRTGDEEGVAMAVEELLRQGSMAREEAIVYLQDVKAELNYLRAQQEKLHRIQELREAINMKKKDEAIYKQAQQRMNKMRVPTAKEDIHVEKALPLPKAPATKQKQATTQVSKMTPAVSTKPSTTVAPPQQTSQRASEESVARSPSEKRLQMPLKLTPVDIERFTEDRVPPQSQQEAEVVAMLQKLKGASSQYDEYTLEEVIYWLAKDMLAHSIIKGDQSAEEALARFATFVESQVAQNKISGEVEKKVLDIMLAALVDILRELSSNQYNAAGSRIPQGPFLPTAERVLPKTSAYEIRNSAIRPLQEIKKSDPAEKHLAGTTSTAQKS
ncbi:uncharacterized protein LOC135385773 isoform X2 [Ornithodoros turicata]|uniref:uncharacterized protein LOC135385773 isoform X2 n=1 Tax=Ornithodoros turicata TaxID=34597 RepID=UPI0031396492